MTRDELVRRLRDTTPCDGWGDYDADLKDLDRAAAARIEADGKLIAEMEARHYAAAEAVDHLQQMVIRGEPRGTLAVAVQNIRAILARLDAEAQPAAGRVSEGEM